MTAAPLTFTVYGLAQPAGSKIAGRTNTGRMFVRDDAKRSRPWKNAVAEAAAALRGANGGPLADLLAGPLAVTMTFHVPRPAGHYGTGRNAGQLRPSAPVYPAVRPDVLKLARAVEDACTGILWRDDAQIVDEHLHKRYGDPARVEVTVTPLNERT